MIQQQFIKPNVWQVVRTGKCCTKWEKVRYSCLVSRVSCHICRVLVDYCCAERLTERVGNHNMKPAALTERVGDLNMFAAPVIRRATQAVSPARHAAAATHGHHATAWDCPRRGSIARGERQLQSKDGEIGSRGCYQAR